MGSALAADGRGPLIARRVVHALLALGCVASRGAAQGRSADSIPALRWTTVAAGIGVAGLASLFDASIARDMERQRTPGMLRTADRLDRFGEVTVIAPVVGGLALAGAVAHRPALMRTALRVGSAVVLSTTVTQVGKRLIGRRRPYEDPDLDADDFAPLSGATSLPSGHTAAAFAFATALGDATGSTPAKIGLYALAAGTAWARIVQRDHWLSDVVAGAGVGLLAGKFASGRLRLWGLHAPQLLLGPRGGAVAWQVPLRH